MLLGALAAMCVPLAAQSHPPEGPTGDERMLFDAANRERVAHHLRALRWDPALARAARDHAELMAHKGAISHQFPGEPGLADRAGKAGARFRLIEENVGEASNAAELHEAWLKSPPHLENLLNAQIDSIGIAVVPGPGQLFGVVDFAKLTVRLSLDDQEHQVGGLLSAQGLRIVQPPGGVRKTCSLDRGIAPGDHAKYLFRYTTADIDQLPGELVAELKKGGYESAAVGACEASDTGSFSAYRLAVLLF
jgi:Cysteine-rich secretory protein family